MEYILELLLRIIFLPVYIALNRYCIKVDNVKFEYLKDFDTQQLSADTHNGADLLNLSFKLTLRNARFKKVQYRELQINSNSVRQKNIATSVMANIKNLQPLYYMGILTLNGRQTLTQTINIKLDKTFFDTEDKPEFTLIAKRKDKLLKKKKKISEVSSVQK